LTADAGRAVVKIAGWGIRSRAFFTITADSGAIMRMWSELLHTKTAPCLAKGEQDK
jgi:hypothetical protein